MHVVDFFAGTRILRDTGLRCNAMGAVGTDRDDPSIHPSNHSRRLNSIGLMSTSIEFDWVGLMSTSNGFDRIVFIIGFALGGCRRHGQSMVLADTRDPSVHRSFMGPYRDLDWIGFWQCQVFTFILRRQQQVDVGTFSWHDAHLFVEAHQKTNTWYLELAAPQVVRGLG